MKFFIAVLAAGLLGVVAAQNGDRALFVKASASHSRTVRATGDSPADVMARNILEWIQGVYRQGTRKIRQQSDAYLPPYSTQRPPERPRPFQPASTPQQPSYSSQSLNEVTGYPSYQQQSSVYSPPNLGSSPSYSSQPTYQTPRPSYLAPSSQSSSSSFASSQNYGSSVAQPRPIPSNPPSSAAPSPSYQPIGSYIPPKTAGYQPSTPQSQPSQNKFSSGYGGSVSVGASGSASVSGSGGYYSPSATPTPSFPTPQPSSTSGYSGSGTVVTGSESSFTSVETNSVAEAGSSITEEDLKHPPHIHEIDVQCSKTMMTINIEFNRAFDGVIYSKGFYTDQNCRYVAQGSGQTKYSFTVSLDSCGTQFINDFEGEAGQAYLENVLVLQNEPGIQEVWDTVRRVRCLWEGNINKALSVSLSVDMLNQEIVTFSGDTATARLDIQMGKGPFAPAADGLVKIGETMTLVVSVEGDPGFDLQVHDCIARDETSTNIVQLTNERGCILKPKLFGAFQKTKDTGNTGASIIAYAFFQAFKFPDVMDLYLECNIELCKTDCEACPEPNQQIDPGRRRRDVSYAATNSSGALSDPVRVGKGFRVIMPEDLSLASNLALEKIEEMAVEEFSNTRNVCMSNAGFYATFSLMLSLLVASTISSVIFYLKLQRIRAAKMLH
ncbi:uncharacterized protein LOC107217492 isoform X1 [Neodiprion lecontei]|uniref:Uncharacterized protein LOC107217492 isoform X1 n=1 Tax=Neodiprion lecontei TaxID=441921 RepID=A0A6J0B8J8_NEOLC|nr:uncharacterized protein LOC107217492 isoform X1 [Neodiprion lecontei]